MEPFDIKVEGAEVVYSDLKPPPYNPLNRPAISYKKPVFAFIVYLAVFAAILVFGFLYFKSFLLWAELIWTLLFGVIIVKKALIWCVHLYQNKASDETRLRCVFEPSCSEYMILAVNKYGFVRGVFKGIRRLLRCHPPNGGKDYP